LKHFLDARRGGPIPVGADDQIVTSIISGGAAAKAESCLDRNVPLGMPPAWRPESGPTVLDFYRRKHATVGPGKYYGLHIVATQPWIRTS
jgi:hypothetical protein